MIELASYLKRSGHRPDAVQDFIPAPMDMATAMYHTGLDPVTMKPVKVAKKMRDRRYQRALLQFFKPENWFEVRKALREAGRSDLIGDGCDCLIPANPPAEALDKRRKGAREALASPNGTPGSRTNDRKPSSSRSGRRETRDGGSQTGYRPHRKSRRR